MTNLEWRVLRLENDLTAIKRQLEDVYQQLGKLAQNQWVPGTMGGGGGAATAIYFCLPTSLAGATGTWPSLTPATQSLTVYQVVSGSLSSIGTATVKNYFPAATAASKVLLVLPDGAGNFIATAQSCS
jgi:hypothetical protein